VVLGQTPILLIAETNGPELTHTDIVPAGLEAGDVAALFQFLSTLV